MSSVFVSNCCFPKLGSRSKNFFFSVRCIIKMPVAEQYFVAIWPNPPFQLSMQTRLSPLVSLAFSIFLATTSAVFADTPNQLTEEEKAGGWKLLFDGKSTQG